MKKSISILEKLYFSLLLVFFFFVISITHIIRGSINVYNIIVEEEYIESLLIILLLFLGYKVFQLYKNEIILKERAISEEKEKIKDMEDKMNDAFRYLGKVNVQIQEIKEALTGLEKFPESKSDFRNILNFLSERSLGMVNCDWVIIRLINLNNLNTLREKYLARGQTMVPKKKISNFELVANRDINGYSIITSRQSNLGLKAYCIFPAIKPTREQRLLIQAIIQELEMIFIIFNSRYYKKQK